MPPVVFVIYASLTKKPLNWNIFKNDFNKIWVILHSFKYYQSNLLQTMFYTQERDKLRQFYVNVWHKSAKGEKMDAIETMVARAIDLHPEYHLMLKNQTHLGNEYLPEMGETNPFLHMGMHLGLQEQVALDRPAGIQKIYQKLGSKIGNVHDTEHAMMDCLAESLWQSQRNNTLPDETSYLRCLASLLEKK